MGGWVRRITSSLFLRSAPKVCNLREEYCSGYGASQPDASVSCFCSLGHPLLELAPWQVIRLKLILVIPEWLWSVLACEPLSLGSSLQIMFYPRSHTLVFGISWAGHFIPTASLVCCTVGVSRQWSLPAWGSVAAPIKEYLLDMSYSAQAYAYHYPSVIPSGPRSWLQRSLFL